MDVNFFSSRQETSQSLRKKAGDLLAQLDTSSPRTKGAFPFGDTSLQRAGKQSDFRQFRPYQTGDRPTDIDWKRSARSDDLLVREREETRRRLWDIYIEDSDGLDFRSKNSLPAKRDIAALLAVTFSLFATRCHDTVRFGGETDKDIADRALAKNSFKPDWRKDSVTILIGDFISPYTEIEKRLLHLSARNVIWLQILDPAELDLPYTGRAIFHDEATRYAVENTDNARIHYQTALDDHINRLTDLARRNNWYFETLRSDAQLLPIFSRTLESLEGKS